jgi:predicted lactoylglutathione lyase
MLFVNLPVADLKRSMAFFAELGFEFDPKFTNEQGACMVVDRDHAYVMLLVEPFFRTFTRNAPCDTARHTEALFALSCESRAEVDALVARAVALGGRHAMPPQDHGFMYAASFYDLDGHHWEVLWMDVQAALAQR